MTHTPAEIDEWVRALVAEAGRDLVFLWNITRGSFGGTQKEPDRETLRAVVSGLVQSGCSIGFGNPDSTSWRVPVELNVPREQLPEEVVRFWDENRDENGFLVFTQRNRTAWYEG